MPEIISSPKKPGFISAFFTSLTLKSFFIQSACLLAVLACLHYFAVNAAENLTRQHIASGFGFLDMRAGIAIPDSLIPYSADSSYKTALLAGLINTLFMSLLCIIAATVSGFAIAFGRLSNNWLLSKICLIYVEIFRNIPVLLVILFFYFALLQQYLPPVRDSIALPFNIYINQRGVYFPAYAWGGGLWGRSGFALPLLELAFAVLCFYAARFFSAERLSLRRILQAGAALGLCLAFYAFYQGVNVELPQKGRFNIIGGSSVSPEFSALFLGLSFYTAALISETARAGIEGVDKGLKEAAASLGFKPAGISRYVTLPLGLRIIVPPLAGQYMNAAKNTSLAVAIGYSDLMRVGNTVLIQTNQSLEVVLIWIAAYLIICLTISVLMNGFNFWLAAAERR